jgi:hypothetical protein
MGFVKEKKEHRFLGFAHHSDGACPGSSQSNNIISVHRPLSAYQIGALEILCTMIKKL